VGIEGRSGHASASTARTSPTVLSGLLAQGLIGSSTIDRLGGRELCVGFVPED
jgi:hypothetical protein